MTATPERTVSPADIVDPWFIPASPGVRFWATFPNPNYDRELLTLADGDLMEISDHVTSVITRKQFINSGASTHMHLDAIRQAVEVRIPTVNELRRLPHAEQYPLIDTLVEYISTADTMEQERGDGFDILDHRTVSDHGVAHWRTTDADEDNFDVDGFALWNSGYMPAWADETAKPDWAELLGRIRKARMG